jgi:excisionase family DNA binding protein
MERVMDEERQRRLSSSEAAKFLGVNVKTLRDWADKGWIPHLRGPSDRSRRWFELADLEAFAETMYKGKLAA